MTLDKIKNAGYIGIKKMLISLGMDNSPDFLIIGAQKAGTVSLKYYLDQHPLLRSARKEVSFFSNNNYFKGLDYYRQFFPIRFSRKYKIFEKTPEYIFIPETAERIHKFNENIKLILLLRNPVDRAYSEWNHFIKYYNRTDGHDKDRLIVGLIEKYGSDGSMKMREFLNADMYMNFNDYINEEISSIKRGEFRYAPSFVRRGMYAEQIKNYYRFFPKEQLLIIESSELKKNKLETLDIITDFLEIPRFDFKSVDLKDAHRSEYGGKRMDEVSRDILREFYDPYNEDLFRLLGKRYDWG